jgi:hypothetical protein
MCILILLAASAGRGQDEQTDDDLMVKEADNPVTYMINLPVQNANHSKDLPFPDWSIRLQVQFVGTIKR